jgi:hypothetical protein
VLVLCSCGFLWVVCFPLFQSNKYQDSKIQTARAADFLLVLISVSALCAGKFSWFGGEKWEFTLANRITKIQPTSHDL